LLEPQENPFFLSQFLEEILSFLTYLAGAVWISSVAKPKQCADSFLYKQILFFFGRTPHDYGEANGGYKALLNKLFFDTLKRDWHLLPNKESMNSNT
jgi:hypothetical protein